MAIFQAVAELGSSRHTAKKHDLLLSVVSHPVSKLDERLGVPLLDGSTSSMSQTDADMELLAASQRMSAATMDGLSAIQARAERPAGTMTITIRMATPLTHSPYAETLTRLAQAYPGINLSILVSDHAASLEGSTFNVAIRGQKHNLDDSSYHVRKLGHPRLWSLASMAYVQGRFPSELVEDLADWNWIQHTPTTWTNFATTANGAAPRQALRIAMTCENATRARKFVDEGLGFMVESYPLVADDLRTGRLVLLFPEVRLLLIEVRAV